MHPEDGARSLDCAWDDGHTRCTFVQRGGSTGPVKHLIPHFHYLSKLAI